MKQQITATTDVLNHLLTTYHQDNSVTLPLQYNPSTQEAILNSELRTLDQKEHSFPNLYSNNDKSDQYQGNGLRLYKEQYNVQRKQHQGSSRNPSITNHVSTQQQSKNYSKLSNHNSTSSGIRKIDRLQNQLATLSVQALNLKSSIDYSNPTDPFEHRDRFNSVGHSRPLLQNQLQLQQNPPKNYHQSHTQKERNCKTSSPAHHFATAAAESRLRKRSSDIKKKEYFADLIVVLGIKYNEFTENRRITPQVVGGYPDLSNKEVSKEHNYVENLLWVCFPEGYSVQTFEKRKEDELCKMKIFHFIITNQNGDKKYITSILFKELFLSQKMGAFIVPKSICMVSSKPIFSLQKQFILSFRVFYKRQLLTIIFQKVILASNSQSIQAYSQPPANYISYIKKQREELILKNKGDDYLMQRLEFYVTIFFKHLYYSEEVDKDIEIEEIRERVMPVEYRADGSKKKQRQKKKIVESYFRYRNTKTYGFTLENYSFELLFQCLKPERILFLITALLLERKIVLIKENFGDIALIMESLVSLLNPLKWNFVFITYLTPNLIECLEAPFPFIIGVSRKVWDKYCVMREYTDDIIIYDIDNQELLNNIREEMPDLPQPQASVLQRSLKGLLDIKERFIETIQENATQKIEKEKIDEYYWAYAYLRVKQSFFNFFLLTINNYIGYFKNLDEEGDLSPNKKDKQFYDKLSSVDVFDFDNYLNQFEGKNKEFMEKFVRTQSFNNFIEETYKNTSPKTIIGFFKTNFEVMLDHSFKKLKREQNKLLDKTFFNLQKPVKFNIGHMFRQYKKQLLMKHAHQIKQMIKEEQQNQEGTEGEQQAIQYKDLMQREDLIQKLLLQEVQENQTIQQTVLNSISYGIITEMPGIQYEQISTYEQIKSQRSDQSQERRYQNKTALQGQLPGLDLQSPHNFSHFQQMNTQDRDESIKSRNKFSNNKIVQSRSGGQLLLSQNMPMQRAVTNFIKHKRSKGGNIYENFLSNANSKNMAQISQDEGFKRDMLIEEMKLDGKYQNEDEILKRINIPNTNSSISDINKINDKIYQKYRVQSENSYAKNFGSFALNKTVVVKTNEHIQRQNTMTPHQYKQTLNQTRNDALHSSQVYKNSLNNTQGNIQQNYSPRILSATLTLQQQPQQTTPYKKDKSKLEKQQQTVLKEALNRKIMHERNKHGLIQKAEVKDNELSGLYNKKSLQISSVFSPNNRSNQNIYKEDLTNKHGPKQSQKLTQQQNIDLMNPRNKKISRNEERKLAKKKGFLDPQQHESFAQFMYSPNEELNKLALMQIFKRKVDQGQISNLGLSKDQLSFSNLFNQNYNSNTSDDDILSKILAKHQYKHQQATNQIQFQKRLLEDPGFFVANDPLSTTINFQSNKIQQKPQLQQSPSISNTQMSSIKKSQRLMRAQQQQQTEDENDDDYVILESQSPQPDFKKINHIQSILHSSQPQRASQNLDSHQQYQKLQSLRSHNTLTQSVKDQKLSQAIRGIQNQIATKDQYQQNNLTQNNFEDSIDQAFINSLIPQSTTNNSGTPGGVSKFGQNTHKMQIQTKHPKLLDQESPKDVTYDKNGYKLNTQTKKLPQPNQQTQNQIQARKQAPQVNSGNKSPTNSMSSKLQKSLKKPINMQMTFDNTTPIARNQQLKSGVQGNSTLERKRSQPAVINNNDKQQYQPTKPHQKSLVENSGAPSSTQKQVKKAQQSFTYFKQRPINQNAKQNKSSNQSIHTFQIDLEKKQKLSNEQQARINLENEMASLRISPIPNMDQVLQSQKNNNLQHQAQNQSSSDRISEDQVILQNFETVNNRSSNFQFNSSIGNNTMNNYMSRQSNQSQNTGNQDLIFSSISQVIDADLFDKAQLTMTGTMSVKNEKSKKEHSGKQSSKHIHHQHQKLKNQLVSISQRSSSNLQNDLKQRSSQLSKKNNNRPSQTSLVGDINIHEKNYGTSYVEMLNRNQSIQSDALSQNEISNNTPVSIMKGSPKMTNQTSSKIQNGQFGSKNFLLQGGGDHNSIQNSLLTSQDSQKIGSVLKALKNQLPASSHNVNVVQIDLKRKEKIVLSPKGLSGKKEIIKINQMDHGLKKEQATRISSVEASKGQKFNEQKKSQDYQQANRALFNQSTITKKQARSPQPQSQTPASQQKIMLNFLHSQEFQLKEKIRVGQKVSESVQQIQDPKVRLYKNDNRTKIKKDLDVKDKKSQMILMKTKSMNQSNGKIMNEEESSLDRKYHTNSMVRFPKQLEAQALFSQSTKNLYHQQNKEQLQLEIETVNETLMKLQERGQEIKKQGVNILEETLTSKSNSNASYQTSPINSLSQNQKFSGLKSASVFKTINNQQNTQNPINEKQSINSQGGTIPTVRNVDYPVKNFMIQNNQSSKYIMINLNQQQTSSNEEIKAGHEHDNNTETIIDFPRQITDFNDEKISDNSHFQLIHQVSNKTTLDKPNLFQEPTSLNKLTKGYFSYNTQEKISNSGKNLLAKSNSINRVNNQISQENWSALTKNVQKPLEEIRNDENKVDHQGAIRILKENTHLSQELKIGQIQIQKKMDRQISEQLTSSQKSIQGPTSSRFSHNIQQNQLPDDLSRDTLKKDKKKRQLRHGLTTCYEVPSKESVQYVRRDLNQDVFCKISSHIGDLDNDPHTPKSDGSIRSRDKASVKKIHKKMLEDINMINLLENEKYENNLQSQQETIQQDLNTESIQISPMRLHSSSFEGSQNLRIELNKDQILQDNHYGKQRAEIEESNSIYGQFHENQKGITSDMCNNNNPMGQKQEILFDDADLRDTDDKFTSRDYNFIRLKSLTSDYQN